MRQKGINITLVIENCNFVKLQYNAPDSALNILSLVTMSKVLVHLASFVLLAVITADQQTLDLCSKEP